MDLKTTYCNDADGSEIHEGDFLRYPGLDMYLKVFWNDDKKSFYVECDDKTAAIRARTDIRGVLPFDHVKHQLSFLKKVSDVEHLFKDVNKKGK